MRNSGSADAPSTNLAQIKLLSAFKSSFDMYVLDHDLEVALINVAVMYPNTSIDELLLLWLNRYYGETADDFEYYYS